MSEDSAVRVPAGKLVYALAGTLLLLAAWEAFAHRFTGTAGLRTAGPVMQDTSNNDELDRALRALPKPSAPRVVVFGSSQVDTVKELPGASGEPIPFRLSEALGTAGVAHEVLDFSGPGQQVIESLVILIGGAAEIRPTAVILCVGLFSMLRPEVRESLPPAVDMGSVRAAVTDPTLLPDADSRAALLRALPDVKTAAARTVQDRIDARLGAWLAGRLVMVDRRRVMFSALIDHPIRGQLAAHVQHNWQGSPAARSFEIGPGYASGLAALEVMGQWSARARVPCVLVIMPYESTREPIVYPPATQEKVVADLRAIASRTGAVILDLGQALTPADFGTYVDGSPDGLHFGARGHEVVGRAMAESVRPLIGSRAAAR